MCLPSSPQELAQHPAIKAILDYKWKHYARLYYMWGLFLYHNYLIALWTHSFAHSVVSLCQNWYLFMLQQGLGVLCCTNAVLGTGPTHCCSTWPRQPWLLQRWMGHLQGNLWGDYLRSPPLVTFCTILFMVRGCIRFMFDIYSCMSYVCGCAVSICMYVCTPQYRTSRHRNAFLFCIYIYIYIYVYIYIHTYCRSST